MIGALERFHNALDDYYNRALPFNDVLAAKNAVIAELRIATAAREYVAVVEAPYPVRLIDLEENKAGKAWRKLVAAVEAKP